MSNVNDKSIILFDGVCKFCHASVIFVLKRDTGNQFQFCFLQSETGKKLASDSGIPTPDLSSMILLDKGKVYYKSSAALRIARKLAFPWPLLFVFILLPPVVRNAVYDFIGNHRYQWFGKYDQCVVPDHHTREKFLD